MTDHDSHALEHLGCICTDSDVNTAGCLCGAATRDQYLAARSHTQSTPDTGHQPSALRSAQLEAADWLHGTDRPGGLDCRFCGPLALVRALIEESKNREAKAWDYGFTQGELLGFNAAGDVLLEQSKTVIPHHAYRNHKAARIGLWNIHNPHRPETRVHNHPPHEPDCNERMLADGQLRGACLNDDGTDR